MLDTLTEPTETEPVPSFPSRAARQGMRETLPCAEPFEFREAADGSPPRLVGLAARTEIPYQVETFTDSFAETIERGAFKRTLNDGPDVVLLVEHTGLPLARTSSGTLELRETDSGLEMSAELDPADPDVARLIPKLRRGDMSQMSIGFRVNRQTWNEDYTERAIHEINLARGDVSVVAFPANPNTSAALRAAQEAAEVAEPAPQPEAAAEPPAPSASGNENENLAGGEQPAAEPETETPTPESGGNENENSAAFAAALREQNELTAEVLDRLNQIATEIQAQLAGREDL